MTQEDKDFYTLQAMLTHGGSFVKQLAKLAQVADPQNLAKIKAAWPEYWQRYEAMATEAARRNPRT